MPTSGEARIRPTSTYNLRSRPLPKTRQATSSTSSSSKNKENLPHSTSKLKKSQIPVPVRTTPLSKTKGPTNTPGSGRSKSKPRTVPDFAKLHKSWQQSFSKGKACNKRKCTQVREFDLTKPGMVFQPKFYDGKSTSSTSEEDELFETDEGALQSILNEDLPATSNSGRSTMAGFGGSGVPQPKPSRQTLAALPSTFQGRANNTQNARNLVQSERRFSRPGYPRDQDSQPMQEHPETRKPSRRKESMAEQQHGMDINFEADAGALASILNNTGADFHHRTAPKTRQTIGAATGVRRTPGSVFSGRQSQGPVRTSIYYQRPRNMNFDRAFTDYANHLLSRLSLATNTVPPTRGQPLPFVQTTAVQERTLPQSGSKVGGQVSKVGGQSHLIKSAARRVRTPLTASRVRNQHFQAVLSGQDTTSSPALRAPPSALKKATSEPKVGKAQSVKWADVFSPPGEKTAATPCKDELVTTLFAEEDTQFLEPYVMNPSTADQGHLQAACLAKQDEIQQLEQQAAVHRTKLEEMDEIERQLELEIEKLQQDGSLQSPTSGSPKDLTKTDSHPERKQNLPCPQAPSAPLHEHENFPEESALQTLKLGYFSRPDSNSVQIPSLSMEGVLEANVSPIMESAAQTQSSVIGCIINGNQELQASDPTLTARAPEVNTRTVSSEDYRTTLITGKAFQNVQVPEKPFAETRQSFVGEVGEEFTRLKLEEPRAILDSGSQKTYQTGTSEYSTVESSSLNSDIKQVWKSGSLTTDRQSLFNDEMKESNAVHMNQNYKAAQKTGFAGPSRDLGTESHGRELFGSQNQDATWIGSQQRSGNQAPLPTRNFDHVSSCGPSNQYFATSCNETEIHQQPNFFTASPFQPSSSNPFGNQGFPVQTNSSTSVYEMSKSVQTPSRNPHFNIAGVSSESFRPPFMSGKNEQNKQFTDLPPSSWMSSTPAPIQTPHAVKPHSMIKELVLKQSLPSSNRPGTQPINRNNLPIHTPLAMRTMSMWNGDDLGASPVQIVSPFALRSGQTPQRELKEKDSTAEIIHSHLSQPRITVNCDLTSSTTATSYPGDNTNDLQPTEQMKTSSNLRSKGQGSLSLGAELMTSGGAAAFLKSKMKPLLSAKTDQLFHEALLDEECALYACRLPSKFIPRIADNHRCFDPVAKILMDGDDMHFVPIQSKGQVYISSPIGSAFNMYSNIAS